MLSSICGRRIRNGCAGRQWGCRLLRRRLLTKNYGAMLAGRIATCLLVYAPGSSPDDWPANMAKFIPAGSDLVFQIHYTTNGRAAEDQTSVGMVFAKTPPPLRVLTLQLTNDKFVIPPGADDFRVEVHGTLPNDCTLLSFFPHMHLRGKRFEYNIVRKNGMLDPLLRVNYHFHWQMSYRLAEPLALKAGTTLQAVASYDNSDEKSAQSGSDASGDLGRSNHRRNDGRFLRRSRPSQHRQKAILHSSFPVGEGALALPPFGPVRPSEMPFPGAIVGNVLSPQVVSSHIRPSTH